MAPSNSADAQATKQCVAELRRTGINASALRAAAPAAHAPDWAVSLALIMWSLRVLS